MVNDGLIDQMPPIELIFFFFLIAILYSAVGFGGGSSYLAILALYGIDYKLLRLVALICNIVVVTGGSYIFWKKGFVPWKKIIPLIILSVPLAFLGGSIQLSESIFFIILGMVLTIAGLTVFFIKSRVDDGHVDSIETNAIVNGSMGGSIGFISGLVGIGGGIFLSPLLHLMQWDRAKIISASCSVFILVNSMAGVAGQLTADASGLDYKFIGYLAAAVFLGGQIGSRLGAVRLSNNQIRKWTAILVVFVGLRLLYKYGISYSF